MRTYVMVIFLCANSLITSGQTLELEKASPFTAVRWERNLPIIQYNNQWYQFERLDHLSKTEILDFCKKRYGPKWQRRFSEDLVEVLKGLGYQPNVTVRLQLSKDGISKTYIGTFSLKNRQRALEYNRGDASSTLSSTLPRKITISEALKDVHQFGEILHTISSYVHLSTYDYKAAIKTLSGSIKHGKREITVHELTNELSKIMSEIGDRHSSIKSESFPMKSHKTYTLKLPFAVATLDGKIIALKQHPNDKKFEYYHASHPYIKSIDGVAIDSLIALYNYKDQRAPLQAKLSKGSRAIQHYGALMFKNNVPCPESVSIIFGNTTTEKEEIIQLTKTEKGYTSTLRQEQYRNSRQVEEGDFKQLSKILKRNIGYINIPKMYHYDEVRGLKQYLESTLHHFSDTKALIIDLRNNPGGGRALIKTFANYIVQPEQSPWIANIAYLRTNNRISGDLRSMSDRYLYSYSSKQLTNKDREAIALFNLHFKLQKFDNSKFSNPFYMVLHSGKEHYKQPVYVLVNEHSFSAASVFTSAFKGLANVTIVGVTTDGASGNSRIIHLKHSNISVKVSTMLSFQRNGTTLDGRGTIPDIKILVDENQLLEGTDKQLSKLVGMINNDKGK